MTRGFVIVVFSKNHQRALDSMQVSLEAESRGKAEAYRLKKKLESDINELEVALDGANRARVEAEKNIKRIQQQIHEVRVILRVMCHVTCHFTCHKCQQVSCVT